MHLCKSCGVTTLFADETGRRVAVELGNNIRVKNIPLYRQQPDTGLTSLDHNSLELRSSDLAFFYHTSGTSSGLPKPVPQSHWSAVGALPRLSLGQLANATFTTTPLYHGGLADCLRAWTAGAMIWLFPEGRAPITARSVLDAVAYARRSSPVPVLYFTSVPYVLQFLAAEGEGVWVLKSMNLVGVGGAALPATVGDELVAKGVKLVSRMGSAECGFLMSSHRDYAVDKDWQYLRSSNDPDLLAFEPTGDGLAELVIRPHWPVLAKTNREDGSYATSDLFEAHPTIPNAWRYHSRADSQIALANGKKFDPSPMEGAILASTNLLCDVLVFGAGRDFPGALLFASPDVLPSADVIETLWPSIEQINNEFPGHARLSRTSLITIRTVKGREYLPKSSKGTIMRRQSQEWYAEIIETVYARTNSAVSDAEVQDDEIQSRITDEICRCTGRQINQNEDLFRQGVDSMACIQIRRFIERTLMPADSPSLPLNIVYDLGTVDALAKYIVRLRQGNDIQDPGFDIRSRNLMRDLAGRYSDFQPRDRTPMEKTGVVVVLTGATGALGAHILGSLLRDQRVGKVYCLVRAPSSRVAYDRVDRALTVRGLAEPQAHVESSKFDHRVICLPCVLSGDNLGLSQDTMKQIVEEATLVIHAAWAVNFSLQLKSFEDHLAGVRNLIKCARQADAHFYFISSTAAVSDSPNGHVPETISSNPKDAAPLGYAQSKWVAEQICSAAHEAEGSDRSVSIIRVGQLCGNKDGVWNESEAYPLMLSTARIAHCLPDLGDEPLRWLPVDLAATAILEIILPDKLETASLHHHHRASSKVPVYHVLNPHKTPKWHDMLRWIRESRSIEFDTVPPQRWLEQLESSLSGRQQRLCHPSQGLIGFWKAKYTEDSDANAQGQEVRSRQGVQSACTFDLSRTKLVSRTMADVKPLDRLSVQRMWSWIDHKVGK